MAAVHVQSIRFMKAKALKRYRRPAYPTRLEVLSHPDLLKRHIPPGWRAVPEVAGTVALFLTVNSTVKAADAKPPSPPGAAAIVAPIFEHGEGRGATGCVVIAPPVFLSEEEAWQVIDEELARQNLKLPATGFEVRGVKVARRMEHYSESKDGKFEAKEEEMSGTAKPFKADRVNFEKKIALEFVSQGEYADLGGPRSMSTVQSYDFKKVAQSLAEKAGKQAQDKVYLGVLYDPVGKTEPPDWKAVKSRTVGEWTKFWQESQKKGRAEAQRLLRLQVQDFVKWLQAQGAI